MTDYLNLVILTDINSPGRFSGTTGIRLILRNLGVSVEFSRVACSKIVSLVTFSAVILWFSLFSVKFRKSTKPVSKLVVMAR